MIKNLLKIASKGKPDI